MRAAASKLESDDGELALRCRRVDLEATTTAATASVRARAAAEAVHSRAYLSRLQRLCDESEADQNRPLKVADEADETEFTYVTPGSLGAALAAVEAALALWDLVDPAPLAPRASSRSSSSPPCPAPSPPPPRAALALVRPPGHHAGRGTEGAETDSPEGAPSGFCLVNTAAAVARSIASGGSASSSGGPRPRPRCRRRRRVLVIDWDVHVGDGTQDIFWGGRPRARRGGRGNKEEDGEKRSSGGEQAGADDGEEEEEEEAMEEQQQEEEEEEEEAMEDEEVCVIDLHEAGAWPGGGGVELRGAQSASGRGALRTGDGTPLSRVINVPLPSGSGDATARAAFERIIVPVAARFKPEAIVVSAGFDAHKLEPLAGLAWTDETYRYLGAATARLAERLGPCGVLLLLEGGYSRRALRTAVAALAEGAATLEVPPAPAAAEGERDPVMEREGEVAISAVVEEHGL